MSREEEYEKSLEKGSAKDVVAVATASATDRPGIDTPVLEKGHLPNPNGQVGVDREAEKREREADSAASGGMAAAKKTAEANDKQLTKDEMMKEKKRRKTMS